MIDINNFKKAASKYLLPSLAIITTLSVTAVQAETFSFVAIGDMPYGKPEKVYAPYEALIAEINAENPDLVIHVGDTKSGSTPCSDKMLDDQLGYLNSFTSPVLYTPGDNEWTDCHRRKAGEFDPLERLAYIRQNYFTDPASSFGQKTLTLANQAAAGFPENARVLHKDIMFITAHVVGSNNNFEPRELSAAEEFFKRNAANIQWLEQSFDTAIADSAKAVVLSIHADMFEFDFDLPWDSEGFLRHSGFVEFAEKLATLSNQFAKPVLLVFGDSHTFRSFRPLPKKAPMIMAVEVFGSKNMHAVKVIVDTDARFPFGFMPLINPARPIEAAEVK